MESGGGKGQLPSPFHYCQKKKEEKGGEIEKNEEKNYKKTKQNDLNAVYKWVKIDEVLRGNPPHPQFFLTLFPPMKIPWRRPCTKISIDKVIFSDTNIFK